MSLSFFFSSLYSSSQSFLGPSLPWLLVSNLCEESNLGRTWTFLFQLVDVYHSYSATLHVPTEMDSTEETFDFKLYRYTPSLAAAVLFLVLFLLITLYHLYQVIRLKSWYFLVFVIGGICKSPPLPPNLIKRK